MLQNGVRRVFSLQVWKTWLGEKQRHPASPHQATVKQTANQMKHLPAGKKDQCPPSVMSSPFLTSVQLLTAAAQTCQSLREARSSHVGMRPQRTMLM